MKDILDEGLIITLVLLQSKKENVMANYFPSSPQMAPAKCGGGCAGTCNTGCAGGCKTGCAGACKTGCAGGCKTGCAGTARKR